MQSRSFRFEIRWTILSQDSKKGKLLWHPIKFECETISVRWHLLNETKQTELRGSKAQAKKALKNFKRYVGIALIASSAFGTFLLGTDKSLWLLASSHAYGLAAICLIYLILGLSILSLRFEQTAYSFWRVGCTHSTFADRRYYDRSACTRWQCLFARYLFGLWAFDGLLIAQGVIIAVVLSGNHIKEC